MRRHTGITAGALASILLISLALSACARTQTHREAAAAEPPPPGIQAWMDRLTVDHEYDPETGFIVARETIALPPLFAEGPSLSEAVAAGMRTGRPVVVFATADRCAPCQQYKKDALNDTRVIRRLESEGVIAAHIEVDRDPVAAEQFLRSLAIPMTYLLRNGEVAATMRGQRSAADLLAWLDEQGV